MPFGLLLSIAIGGALGSVARHYVSTGVYHVTGPAFPFGILAVNVIGGLGMGIVDELGQLKLDYSPGVRAFLTTGILGDCTTFSAVSPHTALLIEPGEWPASAAPGIAPMPLPRG